MKEETQANGFPGEAVEDPEVEEPLAEWEWA